MPLDVRSIMVPDSPYPEDTPPPERLDRTDTFLAPDGRYYGECKSDPAYWDSIPERHRLVLAVLTEIDGFSRKIYRAAKPEEISDLYWKAENRK